MKKFYSIIFLNIFTLCAEQPLDKIPINTAALQALLAMNAPNNDSTRVPTPPNFLGFPLGSVIFQGYNGGGTTPYTQGANVGGYSGLPTPTTPTANQTFPANIIFTTVPSSGGAATNRLSIQSNGRVGIGNFTPTDTTTANAALNVEGTTAAVADSTVHVGSRTTALAGFTGMTGNANVNYNLQSDGNMLVSQATLVNNAKASGDTNILPCTFIRSIPVTGFTISTPGVYCFANNITYTPSGTNSAITISASGVVLDLQSFTLTQGNATSSVSGIQIATGVTDVMVMNGTIRDFTHTGVFGVDNLERIAVQDITIINVDLRAIAMVGAASPHNDTIYINNCRAILCGAAGSDNSCITTQQCDNVFVSNCSVSQYTNSTGIANPYFFSAGSNIIVNDCVASNCTAPSIRGFYLSDITGGKISRCAITGNSAISEIVMNGFLIDISSDIEFFDCCALSNTSAVSASVVVGFLITSSTDILFDRCVGAGQSQTGGGTPAIEPRGLRVDESSSSVVVRNSIFYQNTGVSPLVPVGVECQGNDCLFIHCTSHTNNLPTTATLTGIGFSMLSIGPAEGLNNGFINCNAYNNDTGFMISIAGGAVATQNQFFKNASCKNTTNYSALFPAGSTIAATTITGLNALTNPWGNINIT